ncbi:hypothetical protein [Dactylosporangium darangshiense]|uniref:hypothetical protein n=1 Tax=Dactylosporangium darangshiense TaxID=579108 RepID=UPI0031E67B22
MSDDPGEEARCVTGGLADVEQRGRPGGGPGYSDDWLAKIGALDPSDFVALPADEVDDQPMPIAKLAAHLVDATDGVRWRYVGRCVGNYWSEPADVRNRLLVDPPASTGDPRWDVFVAALADLLSSKDGHPCPVWAEHASLPEPWWMFDTPDGRAAAEQYTPDEFRRRGVMVSGEEFDVA